MRRVDPVFPDLFPVTHRVGPVPVPENGMMLDPIEMRLLGQTRRRNLADPDRSVPRRPVRALVHGEVARYERTFLEQLLGSGCGLLLVLEGTAAIGDFPRPSFDGQIIVMTPVLLDLWGGYRAESLRGWREAGYGAGVLLAVAPSLDPAAEIERVVSDACAGGAEFLVTAPLAIPPSERHRVYDERAGEGGDEVLENLLFHSDLSRHTVELEREVSRACRGCSLAESLPGPATSVISTAGFEVVSGMLLWARRLDLLDGVGSPGWQLRRAAAALLAAGRDPSVLGAEDNLRIVPGFTPWVEAFTRAMSAGSGEPFDEVVGRWIAA